METFYQLGYRETNLVRLNRVCNYVQVIYLIKITEGNGNEFPKDFLRSLKEMKFGCNFGEQKISSERDLFIEGLHYLELNHLYN